MNTVDIILICINNKSTKHICENNITKKSITI